MNTTSFHSLIVLGVFFGNIGCHAFTPTATPTRVLSLAGRPPSSDGWRSSFSNHHLVTTQRNPCPALQMVSYETLVEKLPSKAVIDAVEESSGGKIVASDVAASAGVSLSEARKELTALASISRGDIAVDQDGELIYTFPRNLNSVLAGNSAKYKALQTFRTVWPSLFWLVRVSFGVTLLASILAIFSTIFFLSSASSDDDRRRDDRGPSFGGGVRMGGTGYYNPWWGPSPFDVFYYGRPYGYYAQPDRDPDEMGFFESVFSYIFGDGNPNHKLEEKRLSLVASMIRQSNGAVTAEQLAPFCDDAPEPSSDDESTAYVDESFVLPIVSALDGEPQVTEDGEIVYVFPELQTSASSSPSKIMPTATKEAMLLRRAGLKPNASTAEIKQLLNYNRISTRGALERNDIIRILERSLPRMTASEEAELLDSTDPDLLQEQEWEFSLAPATNRFLAAGLGIINLGGALFLGNQLAQYALYGVRLPSYFGVVQSLYPFLLGYAVLFNVIPLVRNIWIKSQNEKIRMRNKTRRNWRTALAGAVRNSRIKRKLQAAAQMGRKLRKLGASKDIVFDTSQPMEVNEEQKQQKALKDFDKLLDNDISSFQ